MPSQRDKKLDEVGINGGLLQQGIAEIFLHYVQKQRLQHTVQPFVRVAPDNRAGAQQMKAGGEAVQHMKLGAVELQNDPGAVGRSKQLMQLSRRNHQDISGLQHMLGTVHHGGVPVLQGHNNLGGRMPVNRVIFRLLIEI
ncbi:hypothetical protein D3C75_1016010 [compost metagenome]